MFLLYQTFCYLLFLFHKSMIWYGTVCVKLWIWLFVLYTWDACICDVFMMHYCFIFLLLGHSAHQPDCRFEGEYLPIESDVIFPVIYTKSTNGSGHVLVDLNLKTNVGFFSETFDLFLNYSNWSPDTFLAIYRTHYSVSL